VARGQAAVEPWVVGCGRIFVSPKIHDRFLEVKNTLEWIFGDPKVAVVTGLENRTQIAPDSTRRSISGPSCGGMRIASSMR
jgi:hypothetical protein